MIRKTWMHFQATHLALVILLLPNDALTLRAAAVGLPQFFRQPGLYELAVWAHVEAFGVRVDELWHGYTLVAFCMRGAAQYGAWFTSGTTVPPIGAAAFGLVVGSTGVENSE